MSIFTSQQASVAGSNVESADGVMPKDSLVSEMHVFLSSSVVNSTKQYSSLICMNYLTIQRAKSV